jgi:hypothetical protein
MRIHACAAAVASVATFALAPLASADSTWWRPNVDSTWWRPSAESVQSFAQLQANSSEAPAFHAGDGSIYDSSLGLQSTRRMANAPQSTSPRTYERRSASSQPAPQVDPADRVPSGSVLPDRPGATADNRPGATVDRYGAPMK